MPRTLSPPARADKPRKSPFFPDGRGKATLDGKTCKRHTLILSVGIGA
jgi:hypothetical protein